MSRNARGQITEDAFKAAARAVFARKGFLRATIADIAEEAGRSSASFYNYFDTKESLLAHLADEFPVEVVGRAEAGYRRDATPRQDIEEKVRAYWTTYRDKLPELVGVFQVAMVDDEFALRWRVTRQGGIDTMAKLIRKAQRQGYAPGMDARTTASALGAMLEHYCYVWLAAGGDHNSPALNEERSIATLSEIWYRAVYWSETRI